MKYATKYLCENKIPDIIDINMGCPAPKVTKNGDGSKLLLDLEKAERIIKAVVASLYNVYFALAMSLYPS